MGIGYKASKDLIKIINQDACKTEMDKLTWLIDMPIALLLLPWCIIVESVCIPYTIFRGLGGKG